MLLNIAEMWRKCGGKIVFSPAIKPYGITVKPHNMIIREIKKLPRGAKYDYTDLFGMKHYNSKKRGYTVVVKQSFGIKLRFVYSHQLEEEDAI